MIKRKLIKTNHKKFHFIGKLHQILIDINILKVIIKMVYRSKYKMTEVNILATKILTVLKKK